MGNSFIKNRGSLPAGNTLLAKLSCLDGEKT